MRHSFGRRPVPEPRSIEFHIVDREGLSTDGWTVICAPKSDKHVTGYSLPAVNGRISLMLAEAEAQLDNYGPALECADSPGACACFADSPSRCAAMELGLVDAGWPVVSPGPTRTASCRAWAHVISRAARRYARCAERNFASLDKGTASIENGDLGPDGKPAQKADGMIKHLSLRQFGHPARELLAPCAQLVEKLSTKLKEMNLEMKDQSGDRPRAGGGGGGGKKKGGGGGKGGKKKGKK